MTRGQGKIRLTVKMYEHIMKGHVGCYLYSIVVFQRDMAVFFSDLPTTPVSLMRASQHVHIRRCYRYV